MASLRNFSPLKLDRITDIFICCSCFCLIIFFDELKSIGLNKYIPDFEIFNSVNQVLRSQLKKPYILKANNLSGGKVSYLAKSKAQAVFIFVIMRLIQFLAPIAKILKRHIAFDKIMGVELFDTYNSDINLFITFRILYWGSDPYFLYPHVSKDHWCVHTDMKDDTIEKEDYISAYNIGIKAYKDNKKVFKIVKDLIGLDIVVFDFLVTKDSKVIFLEPELKYGLDLNFIEGQAIRFNLEADFFQQMQSNLRKKLICFDALFNK